MARTNPSAKSAFAPKRAAAVTHEGAPSYLHQTDVMTLRRSVLSCMLGETTFYEGGVEISQRIADLALKARPEIVAGLAIEARQRFNLRHAPLWLLTALIKTGAGKSSLVSDTIQRVVQRADELTELLALYAKANGRTVHTLKPLSNQLRRGLRLAFPRFDEYQLQKYDRENAVRLRDVLFLVHGKPRNDEQAALWKRLTDQKLAVADTWEVALSAGGNKKEVWERLIGTNKLGYLALLRNLRNMEKAGVDRGLVEQAILARKGADRVLPFRYTAAARAAPDYEPVLDKALIAALDNAEALDGLTAVLVDVSGSMDSNLSEKSDLSRADAAATLAVMVPGNVELWTFSDDLKKVPPRRGMAGIEAILGSQIHSGTRLGESLRKMTAQTKATRLIVITDEQSHDAVALPKAFKWAYLINVAPYKNGVGYGKPWVHIDGFSEATLDFIREYEREAR